MKEQSSRDLGSFFLRLAKSVGPFAKDYAERHRHPVNAALHIVGVPAVLYGLFKATTGRNGGDRGFGVACVVFGYLLQYLGHKRQGNEVGEVSLIKFLVLKLREASHRRMRSYNWLGAAGEGDGEDKKSPSEKASAGKSKSPNGNGNGHHGSNGNGSSGRYILWWKTSH